MKLNLDDEFVDKIVIARLKDDIDTLNHFIKPLRKKAKKGSLTTVEYQDHLRMTDDLFHIEQVLAYYGVYE